VFLFKKTIPVSFFFSNYFSYMFFFNKKNSGRFLLNSKGPAREPGLDEPGSFVKSSQASLNFSSSLARAGSRGALIDTNRIYLELFGKRMD
jgi:hypothetical protein